MPLSEARTPRPRVLIDGTPLAGVLAFDTSSSNHLCADRFTVSAALDLAAPSLAAASASSLIELQASLDGAVFASLLTGRIDHLSLDPIHGTATLEGRDRTADLIDAITQETFANRTSSEVAALLAARHGLAANVTPTTALVGRLYQSDRDRLTLASHSQATTEWDLLCGLAELEGFDVYVTGATLTFAPPAPPGPALPLTQADCLTMRLDRALGLARDLEVTVTSWNSRTQQSITQTARRAARQGGIGGGAGTGGAGTGGPPLRYAYVAPNLSAQEALALAQSRLAELSQHERVVTLTLPAELTLAARATISLTDTGTDFDQTYTIDRLQRRLDLRHGFTARLHAKALATPS